MEAALEHGHDVTLFNRGMTNPELFPGLERLTGDRDGDLGPLRGRSWDAVVDTSGYVPRVVRLAAELLADSVAHYAFVSTISVYADTGTPGIDETAPVLELTDETDENVAANYGALKAACERVVRGAFAERSVIVRAGLIVGPHDPTNRFTYWVTRLAAGGRSLAPEPRTQPVQLIDVRDLSRWMLRALKQSVSGVYNVTGPAAPLTLNDTLETIRRATSGGAELVWVDEAWLVEQGVEPWSELPLWLAPTINPEYRGFLAVDIRRALDAGLTLRPLEQTAAATLEWARAEPASAQGPSARKPAGLAAARERELLERWS